MANTDAIVAEKVLDGLFKGGLATGCNTARSHADKYLGGIGILHPAAILLSYLFYICVRLNFHSLNLASEVLFIFFQDLFNFIAADTAVNVLVNLDDRPQAATTDTAHTLKGKTHIVRGMLAV